MQNEAGQRQIEFCQEKALVIANTIFQQHKRRLYTWTSSDSQQRNQTDYILCSQRWRSSIQSAKTRPGADCGSNHELLIAKFRLKLKFLHKKMQNRNKFSSVAQLCPTLRPHGLQHTRLPCPSPSPGPYSNSCTSSW